MFVLSPHRSRSRQLGGATSRAGARCRQSEPDRSDQREQPASSERSYRHSGISRPGRTRGVALAVVLFLLVALALLTVTMMTAAQEATRLAMASADDPASLESGRAGVQVAETLLKENQIALAPNQMVYLTWPGSQPWVQGDAHADPYASAFLAPAAPATAFSPAATTFPSAVQSTLSANFPGLQWVRIWPEILPGSANSLRLIPVTTSSGTVMRPVVQIAAYVKRGLSTRMVVNELISTYSSFPQMNPSSSPYNPLVPAALMLVGNNPTYTLPHSNNWTVSGIDLSNGSAPPVVALGGSSDAGTSALQTQAFRPDYTHYPGLGVTSPNPSIVNTVSANVMSPSLETVAGLQQFVAQVRAMANIECGSGSPCPSSAGDGTGFLDPRQPRVTVVDGNYSLPAVGGGILLVTGALSVPNNFQWNGLLMVVGSGQILFNTGSGGGSPLIKGAMFAANPCANLSGATPLPDLSNCTTMGSAVLNTFNGGGNGVVNYDSALIAQDLFTAQEATLTGGPGNSGGNGSNSTGTLTWQALSLSQFTPPN